MQALQQGYSFPNLSTLEPEEPDEVAEASPVEGFSGREDLPAVREQAEDWSDQNSYAEPAIKQDSNVANAIYRKVVELEELPLCGDEYSSTGNYTVEFD